MVPIIVRVICEDVITDVPITPETTCYDVVECCRDPGDDLCNLVQIWRNYERILRSEDKPLEILQEWGPQQDEVKFVLRYTVLSKPDNLVKSEILINAK
ncbi:conserved hypothetical protein [Pediculus humanus corporis]|uniref:Ras-associating domain-containing protein n=1 Tax=Pediculus humanus subsp. corporis TaxID=121224 RepID=E0VIP8_PEDHC|nr:uncharacterized protein Phum_PHUM230600 [Pediculus humanus corporis]EEB13254.1 conserved hypothetical protein [Pediculus humanus corporis]